MKIGFMAVVLMSIGFFIAVSASAQDFSNKGKDFWIGYGNHVRMFNGGSQVEQMQLYITSDVNTTGQVTIASIGFSQSFTITANQISTIDIPRAAALMDQGLYNHGIHVTAATPVVVYSFIYVNAQSGATVCLPTNTLGQDYYSVNFDQISNEANSASYFFVVAADTGTTKVAITPSEQTKAGQPANVPFFVTLNQGQIYQVLGSVSGNSGVDLTGSRIQSVNTGSGCKRIAVYCGSGKIAIGCTGGGSSDNLYQQMYPTSTWGKKYITIPGVINSNNYFRIVKSDSSAVVRLNGNVVPASAFIKGFYYQFLNNQPNVIESDKAILVAQYYTTQGCAGNPSPGDPEMIYLNPVEQTINSVTLNSMQPAVGTNINQHYLNVVLKNQGTAISSFKLDGSPFTNFNTVPNDNNYVYAQIATTKGTHNITCDTGFNIIAYGFGNAESYGYSGGTNLKDLYQFASIKNQYATASFPATCTDAPFQFSMTFPYKPLKIEWRFNGLFPDEVIDAPSPDSTWFINGRQLFQYKLSKTFSGPAAGTYPIKILAENPTVDGCSGTQEIDYDLNVYAMPIATFSISGSGCLTDSLHFTNTTSTERPVLQWLWNFENGDTSMQRSPAYLYKKTGSYNVSLKYITDIGCVSDTNTQQVIINPQPTALFDANGPYCLNDGVEVKDLSIIVGGQIVKWSWDMGDGKTLLKNDNKAFVYDYLKTGTYTIRLQTESDKGCVSPVFEKVLTVHPKPKAGFIMPENCILDPYSLFTDTSSIADNTASSFVYNWNFGDVNATATNPNTATGKRPRHKYTATGLYTVSLNVTSGDGCMDSLKQVFTISGASPNADFSIQNSSALCSNQDVVLTDNSKVDFGNIVKLEIFWDDNNDPANTLVVQNPKPGDKYTTRYPEFYTPFTKNYSIRVVAYSGENCLHTTSETIVVKATPQLRFDSVAAICADAPAFALSQASVLNSMPGSAVFTGAGTTPAGLFSPGNAGAGLHTIQYKVTGDNGCSNTISQTIQVYPSPVVNAGPDLWVLEGGSVAIKATATGNDLSYTWTPPTGLDKTNVLQPLATPTNDITYKLVARSGDGCTAADEVVVKVLKTPLIPNVFSPNGDGVHDVWEVKYLDSYPSATIEIFNRYGQLVFKSTGYKPWDGSFNGKQVPIGTYYYVIDPKNGRKPMTGFVDVIR